MTSGPPVGAVASAAAPVGPKAGAEAQHAPGAAPLSQPEIDLRSPRAASAHAGLAPYICDASHAPPRRLGDRPPEAA